MNPLIVIFIVAISFIGESSSSHNHIVDHTIYEIISKSDGGCLTVKSDPSSSSSDDLVVKVKDWNDGAGQKWKAKQPLLSKSFEFKPTSNSQANLDSDSMSGVFGRVSTSDDTKSWYVKDMGEGVYQIKNYQTATCIASQGNNKPVKLMSCDNSPAQQWIFKEL